jgi:phosphodiesterase/alkaline phosphatase D-like protein
LSPGETYHVRAYATNSAGTAYGEDFTFTTNGAAPLTYPYNASNILSTSATLAGYVDPNYSSTTVTFEYGTTDSYGQTITATQSPLTGGGSYLEVTRNITGLNPGTIYHFRIKAANVFGTTYSTDMTFTTLGGAPLAYPYNASNILSTSATLAGYVDPNYSSTTITFEYGITDNYGQNVTAVQSPLSDGGSYVEVTRNITGLNPGTIYHFRIKAVNALGTTYSSDMTFTTLGGAPLAYPYNATNILSTSATLVGYVDPNYSSTTITFEYGTTDSYGQSVTATQSPLTGGGSYVEVTRNITGLIAGTLYHFRIKAVNALGTTFSSDLTFTTTGGR